LQHLLGGSSTAGRLIRKPNISTGRAFNHDGNRSQLSHLMPASQQSFFEMQTSGPTGLSYAPDFISPEEEATLLAHIRKLPLVPFQFGRYEGKRRVIYFGHRYDFSHQTLEDAAPIPCWLRPLSGRVEAFAGLPSGSIAHALLTEYKAGSGIGWHRDKKQFGKVFGVSLLSACPFRFRRKSGVKWERYALDVQPRSLYTVDGEARNVWEHSIAPVKSPRYSITFRTLAEG